ncbi:MAG: RNA polymerase sigma factor RpoH [Motiliproteus sp.]|nr:RNA polymerase sigma factor RpoH [Motiliproteus sp.]MCW9051688.1 RNA polymerase sigma factor RpoH [Motiliproteus sp.]
MSQALAIRESKLPISMGSFGALVSFANAYPMISEEEEKELAIKLRDQQDLDAAHRLVLSHLRFVVKIANSYQGYGLPITDVAQEGTIGLMKAVQRFDPSRGVRLASFAIHWIRAEIYEYVLRNWKIVKIATTKAQRKLFFRLREAKKSLKWLTQTETERIASDLEVAEEDVILMEQRLYQPDIPFELEVSSDEPDSQALPSPSEYLHGDDDPAAAFENQRDSGVFLDLLHQSLGILDERQRDIVASRWMQSPKASLADLSARHGISMERVRQIEKQAFERLRQEMGKTLVA